MQQCSEWDTKILSMQWTVATVSTASDSFSGLISVNILFCLGSLLLLTAVVWLRVSNFHMIIEGLGYSTGMKNDDLPIYAYIYVFHGLILLFF